ncbi:hypothetical protein [Acinetobacter sp. 1592897]|uniref:hypothetical protein n=1 Tax=Acinetobacter sp. 1592897 TaxID=1310696 RepID=UPI000AD36914|nr:hypothetical protein [Acinetobacter sp. 1592897]
MYWVSGHGTSYRIIRCIRIVIRSLVRVQNHSKSNGFLTLGERYGKNQKRGVLTLTNVQRYGVGAAVGAALISNANAAGTVVDVTAPVGTLQTDGSAALIAIRYGNARFSCHCGFI